MTDRVPQLFDVIDCDRDFPELGLAAGEGGAIVECHGDGAYEVEVCDGDGETRLMFVVSLRNAALRWDLERGVWVLEDLSQALKRAFHLLEGEGKTFVAACLAGDVSVRDINSFVDAWSETVLRRYSSLREVLGMAVEEYLCWEGDAGAIEQILEERRCGVSVARAGF